MLVQQQADAPRQSPRSAAGWFVIAGVILVLVAAGLTYAVVSVVRVDRAPKADDRTSLAVDSFFDRYVLTNGRVARTDQGGDTVSEGQAYAMLMAVAVGDQDRFDTVWQWTRSNLMQPNGLLAWHWADGRVVDSGAAADADLIVAASLAMAADRFGSGQHRASATALSRAILREETVFIDGSPVLVAGPWAVTNLQVNPSYWAPSLMTMLATAVNDPEWEELADSSRAMTDSLTAAGPHLPPDWASVSADGAVARPAPDGQSPRYGWDAVRLPVLFAVDCDRRGQALSARTWGFLSPRTGPSESPTLPSVLTLSGQPMVDTTSATALVAAAAGGAAAGDRGRSAELLDSAEAMDRAYPTYYGGAWVALGRILLETDLAGGCRPGSPTS